MHAAAWGEAPIAGLAPVETVVIEPLEPDDGSGFLAAVPDLPGCMSEGETPEEALANIQDAVAASRGRLALQGLSPFDT